MVVFLLLNSKPIVALFKILPVTPEILKSPEFETVSAKKIPKISSRFQTY